MFVLFKICCELAHVFAFYNHKSKMNDNAVVMFAASKIHKRIMTKHPVYTETEMN